MLKTLDFVQSLSTQHSLSNLVIYLFRRGGGNPTCCNGNMRTKHTGGLSARARTNMYAPALSVSMANQILSLRPSKEGITCDYHKSVWLILGYQFK